MSVDAPRVRRRQSKAARNERRKAAAATLNALSVASLATALFQPVATGRMPQLSLLLVAFGFFIVMQWAAHYILNRMED